MVQQPPPWFMLALCVVLDLPAFISLVILLLGWQVLDLTLNSGILELMIFSATLEWDQWVVFQAMSEVYVCTN